PVATRTPFVVFVDFAFWFARRPSGTVFRSLPSRGFALVGIVPVPVVRPVRASLFPGRGGLRLRGTGRGEGIGEMREFRSARLRWGRSVGRPGQGGLFGLRRFSGTGRSRASRGSGTTAFVARFGGFGAARLFPAGFLRGGSGGRVGRHRFRPGGGGAVVI